MSRWKGLRREDVKTQVSWFHLMPRPQGTRNKPVALRWPGRRPERSPALALGKSPGTRNAGGHETRGWNGGAAARSG